MFCWRLNVDFPEVPEGLWLYYKVGWLFVRSKRSASVRVLLLRKAFYISKNCYIFFYSIGEPLNASGATAKVVMFGVNSHYIGLCWIGFYLSRILKHNGLSLKPFLIKRHTSSYYNMLNLFKWITLEIKVSYFYKTL